MNIFVQVEKQMYRNFEPEMKFLTEITLKLSTDISWTTIVSSRRPLRPGVKLIKVKHVIRWVPV